MALMSGIQQYPMQFVQPMMPPALSANPEAAKAAMYSGGASPAAGGAQPAAASGTAPQQGQGGVLGSISKLFGGQGGQGDDFIMKLLASLAAG